MATGKANYEPPINICFILHIDPSSDVGAPTFKVEQPIYERSRDEINWLASEPVLRDVKMTVLSNGWYTKWAAEHNDVEQFADLVAQGHEVGSHAHSMSYDADQDLWLQFGQEVSRYGTSGYDSARARQAWSDAHRYMEDVLSAAGVTGQNRTMCAWPHMCSEEGQLMDAFGYRFASGNRTEKAPFYFGHIVWNPWRPAALDEVGYELLEDLAASFVSVDHYAQIGAAEEAHAEVDVTPSGVKRNFVMLYAEWLSRVRRGVEDRVWFFGFVHHPNYADKYNSDITDIFSWFNQHFVGKKTREGYTIARYATVSEVGEEYLAWEKEHPGTSSFNYVRGDPYPYTYSVLPTKLKEARYETDVDLEAGVTCFRFSDDGQDLYLLWSDDGERMVNLRELSGQVQITDTSGRTSSVDASAIPLTEEVLFAEQS
jgi:hypothetical protein